MRKTLILVPLFAAACSFPRFTAQKTIETDVSVRQAKTLRCATHNGDIHIRRGDRGDTIALHAVIEVRGHTQQEADERLLLVSIASEVLDDELKILGVFPRAEFRQHAPSITYTMHVPEHLALTLASHNGDIHTEGTKGPVQIETHNGDVQARVANEKVSIHTHNGEIEVEIDASTDLDSELVSHNGNIEVTVSEDASGWLEVATHNGHIDPPRHIYDATIKKRSLRCRIGEEGSEGKLVIETHNGNIGVESRSGRARSEVK
ncbi:MAG: DUF4097 family beta strand repeat protein [Planctomycetes bacterium]|nr:DUF4097 family beta strand repeat protein [Planctomycetota bacterium]